MFKFEVLNKFYLNKLLSTTLAFESIEGCDFLLVDQVSELRHNHVRLLLTTESKVIISSTSVTYEIKIRQTANRPVVVPQGDREIKVAF